MTESLRGGQQIQKRCPNQVKDFLGAFWPFYEGRTLVRENHLAEHDRAADLLEFLDFHEPAELSSELTLSSTWQRNAVPSEGITLQLDQNHFHSWHLPLVNANTSVFGISVMPVQNDVNQLNGLFVEVNMLNTYDQIERARQPYHATGTLIQLDQIDLEKIFNISASDTHRLKVIVVKVYADDELQRQRSFLFNVGPQLPQLPCHQSAFVSEVFRPKHVFVVDWLDRDRSVEITVPVDEELQDTVARLNGTLPAGLRFTPQDAKLVQAMVTERFRMFEYGHPWSQARELYIRTAGYCSEALLSLSLGLRSVLPTADFLFQDVSSTGLPRS